MFEFSGFYFGRGSDSEIWRAGARTVGLWEGGFEFEELGLLFWPQSLGCGAAGLY